MSARLAVAAALYLAVAPPLLLAVSVGLAVRAGWLVIEEERAPRGLSPAEPSGVRDGR